MKHALLGTLLSALVGTTAMAQDTPKYFDGFFVGGDAGITDDGDFYYGAHGGYRVQTDNDFVYGIEGTFGSIDASDSFGRVSAEIDNVWSASAFVGLPFGKDRKNLWTVGGGFTQINASATTAGIEVSEGFSGFRASTGYERVLSDNVRLRFQGNYANYEQGVDGLTFTGGFTFAF